MPMDKTTADQIDKMMRDAVADGVFPGGALLFSRCNRMLFNRAYGIIDTADPRPVSHRTFFDLASLTKPLATTLAVMILIQQGKLDLDREIGNLIPAVSGDEKARIRIADLLCHRSGLIDYRPYYLELGKLPFHERRSALERHLAAEPLLSPPGRQTRYSDIGFMMLEWIIRVAAGVSLEQFMDRHVYHPLGIEDLFFIPTGDGDSDHVDSGTDGRAFAATENCPWRGYTVKGAVHDENAFVMGGVAGQSGLFGTASSVHRLLSSMMAGYAGGVGNIAARPDPRQPSPPVFDPVLLRTFLQQQGSSGRALGFDMPSAAGSSSGDFFNPGLTVGHLGFTGTSFWMDLQSSIIVILLTNRVHPTRANERIRLFRPRLHNAVMQFIGQMSPDI
jgi:serine-type D-Ala-D-Ala carboxypeptidase